MENRKVHMMHSQGQWGVLRADEWSSVPCFSALNVADFVGKMCMVML